MRARRRSGQSGASRRRCGVDVLTTSTRYELDASADLAQVPEVLTVACDGDQWLASTLLDLPRTPWVTVLDAYVVGDHVECVMPLAELSLLDALQVGLTTAAIERLRTSLPETLDLLDGRGLAPLTLRPDDLGFTQDGDVLLLPQVRLPALLDEEEADLLALLDGAAWWAEVEDHGGADDALLVGTSAPLAADRGRLPEVVISPRPTHRRSTTLGPPTRGSWLRTSLLAAATAVAVLGAGVVLGSQDRATPDGKADRTRRAPASGFPQSAASADPGELADLIATLEVAPRLQGPLGPVVLDRLRGLRDDPGSERTRTEAQDLAAVVAVGASNGELKPDFAERVCTVLRPLAQPPDLAALIDAVQVQPQRFGSGVPALLSRLQALSRLSGEAARSEAAALLAAIEAGMRRGDVLGGFRDIAVPVLAPLADPTAQGEDR